MLQKKSPHNKNLTNRQHSQQLDFEYLELRQSILSSSFFKHNQKHIRIRINLWMNKLDQIITNPTWKKNRNNYAKIINLMCQCEVIVEPFSSMPPETDIPKLSKSEVNKLIDEIERFVKLERSKISGQMQCQQKNETLRPYDYWENIKSMRALVKESPKAQTIEDSNIIAFSKVQEFGGKTRLKDSRESENKLKQSLYFLQQTQSLKDTLHKLNKQNKSSMNIKDDSLNLQLKKKPHQPKYPKQVCIKIQKLQNFKKGTSLNPKQPTNYQLDNISNVKNINSLLMSSKQTITNQDNLDAYRDNHQSFSIENNQTLKTQYFDNEQQNSYNKDNGRRNEESQSQYDFNEDIGQQFQEKDQILSNNYFGWRKKEEDNVESKTQQHIKQKTKNQVVMMKVKKIGSLALNPPLKRFSFDDSPKLQSRNSKNIGQMIEGFMRRQSVDNSCQIYEGEQNISITTQSCGQEQSGLKDITNIAFRNKFK